MNGPGSIGSIILFVSAFLASWLGVRLFRRWSLHREFFDVPNERSSHSTPTPRGGGLLIVLVCILGYVGICLATGLQISWGYLVASLLVAAVSWVDDLFSLPFWSRLIVHIGAAVILIIDLGFWSEVSIPLTTTTLELGSILGVILTGLWLVWLLNAYNFMDGIDGIAALQAIISGLAWVVLAVMWNLPGTFAIAGLVVTGSAGFLIHNWQPAKIFMGDVGSAFLGFTLAAIPLLARREGVIDAASLPVIAVLLVWFFVFDTVFTFFRRLFGRQRVWEAHREHIYQKLIIEGKPHSSVTLLYGSVSALLCLTVVAALAFSGILKVLAFLSFVGLTSLVVYLGFRKNVDLNN